MKNSRYNLILNDYPLNGELISAKVRIKTRPANWEHTHCPVILPFSIHSRIYDGDEGTLKIAAFLNFIKKFVNGKVTVLLCEKAHLEVLSLKYNKDMDKTLEICNQDAKNLVVRFKRELEGCEIIDWTTFVNFDVDYHYFRNLLLELFEKNDEFKSLITKDIEKTYNKDRQNEYTDRQSYFEQFTLDLIETGIYLLVASKKGYRFEFYPGDRYSSLSFINDYFLNEVNKLVNINVTIGTPAIVNDLSENRLRFSSN